MLLRYCCFRDAAATLTYAMLSFACLYAACRHYEYQSGARAVYLLAII